MANGLYSREDCEFVKRLLKNGVYLDEFVNRFGFNIDQITAMFQSFRQESYRVFIGEEAGSKILVLKDKYMKMCGYDDKIISPVNEFKIAIVSDTHFGSKNDNPRIMDKVYNFCKGEGIKDIIHLGDVVEGKEYYVKRVCKGELRYTLTDENQLEYLNQNLPYDKGIKMHILAGNHDQFSNEGVALDIIGQLIKEYKRNDISVAGFDYRAFPVNSDFLYLNHGYIRDYSEYESDTDKSLILNGHSHRSKNDICHGYVVETVPTLSNIEHINNNHEAADNRFFVGFITLDISLNENKTFNTIEINRYKLTNSPYSKPKILPSPTTVEYRRFRK